MAEPHHSGLPLLVVVTGRPASGKTTLAHSVARAVGCPVVSRDELKEGLVNTIERGGSVAAEPKRHVYEVFFETIEYLIRSKISVVSEAAFQHKTWAPKLGPLRELARIRVVICAVDPHVARARFIERRLADPNRARFHGDRLFHAAGEGPEPPIGDYDPLRLDVPTLEVDTSDGYSPTLDEVVSFVCGSST